MPSKFFTFWKFALFGGLLAFSLLFWLNGHIGYVAKSALLVKPHNKESNEFIAQTVSAFADTETFKERTLSSTRLIEGPIGEMSSDEQVALFKQVKVRGGETGGLVTVTTRHHESDIAESIGSESLETLLRMSRLYIGEQNELSLIVIDKAIISKGFIQPYIYAFKALGTTLVLFFLILLMEPFFKKIKKYFKKIIKSLPFSKKKENAENDLTERDERDERFVPQKLDAAFLYSPADGQLHQEEFAFPQPKASEMIKGEEYGTPPQNSLQSVSVAMEDLPFRFETGDSNTLIPTPGDNPMSKELHDGTPEHSTERVDKEPTVIEYKRRLNELLSQK